MKKEKLRLAEENEDDSRRDVSENQQTTSQQPGSPTLSESSSLSKDAFAPPKKTTVKDIAQNSVGSVNLDDSVYDFQPTDSKYSVVRRSFGKFSVGVGHKKIKKGKFY